jgi:hypothetical protein
VDEARPRLELEHLEAAVAEGEAGQHEQRRQRQEGALHDAGDQRADHQQRPEDEQHDLELHRDRVSQRVVEGEGLTRCESPCSASRRPGRTLTVPAAAT